MIYLGHLPGGFIVAAYLFAPIHGKEEDTLLFFANSGLDISYKFVIKCPAEHLGLSLLPRVKER